MYIAQLFIPLTKQNKDKTTFLFVSLWRGRKFLSSDLPALSPVITWLGKGSIVSTRMITYESVLSLSCIMQTVPRHL